MSNIRLQLHASIRIHGALPHTPPKETFCKKSPLESRKTIFDFYVWFFIVCSQGIKITIHAADF